ncbi:MAG: hypothetical protein QOI10_198 [Solirubrobacterales bacterium]|jgi:diguanylate cyclase (GGDEF)-like protein|nr:hypothetical protein [Solirubrobacterales bacterium]
MARGMLTSIRRNPNLVLWPLLAVGIAGLLADLAFSAGLGALDSGLHHWLYQAALLVAASVCLVRAAIGTGDRVLWLCFGLGIGVWAGGGVYWVIALADLPPRDTPYPSFADVGYLLAYPLFYVGVLLLIRRRIRFSASTWLDGGVAALASAALLTAILEPALVGLTKGDLATVATNLAYPVGDVILLACLVAGAAVVGRGGGRAWALIGAGILAWGAADSNYLYQVATGDYVAGFGDSIWLLAALLIAAAATTRPATDTVRVDVHSIAVPVISAVTAICVLAWDHLERLGDTSVILALATLGIVVIRMAASFRENRRLFEGALDKSETDPLTGLGNRRAVARDLGRATVPGARESIFVILDLDGFKAYNDRFGHPAGDKLLRRLGHCLAVAIAPGGGTPYRLGGDEFCALVPGGEAQVPGVLLTAAKALGERGQGFEIAASSGAVVVPAEAQDATEAMRIADIRMYVEKSSRSTSRSRDIETVLTGTAVSAETELSDFRGPRRERLAVAVGRMLSFDREALAVLGRAAELHDIGKAAIPERILHKRGPLDPDEWELIRSHTTIGQRIVAGAPAMTPVAELLRSTHERWDGAGYPDGLLGEEIPFGSRVIFVCDAFEAMTEDRPYRVAVSDEVALLEILIGAGTQFDPDVVDALVEVQASA